LGLDDQWRIAGTYDFLKFKKLTKLAELEEQDPHWVWTAPHRLVLFPFGGAEFALPDSVVRGLQYPDTCAKTPSDLPLLVLTTILLAGPAYELGEGHGSVIQAIQSLARLLNGAQVDPLPKPQTFFLGSLSGADLVMLSLPKNPAELHGAHALARYAQTLKLAQLARKRRKDIDEDDKAESRDRPGNACVLVQPMLGFRLGTQEYFDQPEFRRQEQEQGLRLRFGLRVTSGNEAHVVESIRAVSQPEDPFAVDASQEDATQTVTNWNTHQLEGQFRNLGTFIRVWRELWFNRTWRSENLVDSRTRLAFPGDSKAEPVASPWVIHSQVRKDLELIGEQITSFSRQFLNVTQREELAGLFRSFRSCFFRHELLGMARDLFPFFRQLGRALGDCELWHKYLNSHDLYQQLDRSSILPEEFRKLTTAVNRALRNRVEGRVAEGDPVAPETLLYGACKLISAYTVLVFLCNEVLRRPKKGEDDDKFRDAGRFAACVTAGAYGRVVCEELLPDLRRLVESATQTPLAEQQDGTWSARLIVLDISGKSLLRPELSIAHCLHEVAETSDWLLSKRFLELRRVLNHWFLRETVAAFRRVVATLACGELAANTQSPEGDDPRENLRAAERRVADFCTWFVPYCAARFGTDTNQSPPNDVKSRVADLVDNLPPLDFMQYLMDALYIVPAMPGVMSDFADSVTNEAGSLKPGRSLRPPESELCVQAAANDDFTRRLRTLHAFVMEVVSDCGMWLGLERLLASPDTDSKGRSAIIDKAFTSILRLVVEAYPTAEAQSRVARVVVRRWAIQTAAVFRPDEPWEESFAQSIKQVEGECPDIPFHDFLKEPEQHAQQFNSQWGLIGGLRRFRAYGGDEDLSLPDVAGERPDKIAAAFARAWHSPSLQTRIDFLFRLWAKSLRFAIPKLFELT
jgi:hypothetical protein